METLRGQVTESAPNTYTETEIQTPASRSEKLAMLIWRMQIYPDPPSLEDGQTNTVRVHVAKQSATAVLVPENDAVLFRYRKQLSAGAIAGTLSEYLSVEVNPEVVTFAPPFLYAKSSLFIGMEGVGNAIALACGLMIGYTLERVPAELFIAALVD